MIADCSCGAVYWAEPPFSSCPRCEAPVLVRAKLESLEEFEARILRNVETRARSDARHAEYDAGSSRKSRLGDDDTAAPGIDHQRVLRLHASSRSDGP